MNDTTFSGNGIVSFIPVITNANPKPITNADKIRAMTDEELAQFVTKEDLCELTCGSPIPCDGRCEAMMLKWLKSPVDREVYDG